MLLKKHNIRRMAVSGGTGYTMGIANRYSVLRTSEMDQKPKSSPRALSSALPRIVNECAGIVHRRLGATGGQSHAQE
jgi:hypothetical protein